MSAVRTKGIRKSFDRTEVLRGVDLDVPAGSLVAVLGPSGCGKTTLLRIVAGFERPDAGVVEVDDRPVTDLPPERRRVAVVPQEQALFPHLTVAGNVGYGLPRARRHGPRVAELLDLAGLSGFANRMPHELSGGQQQRVAIARALAPSPSVVLLDEPFGGLDAALRAAMRAEVRAILRASGATAVLVTHDQEEALSVADTVAVMRDGVVVQAGTPAEVYAAPADLGVATFVGEANVLPGTVRAGMVETALGRLPLVAGVADGAVDVVVRPEQVAIGEGVGATVVDRLYFGHDALVRLRLADGTAVLARTGVFPDCAPGEVVGLTATGPVTAFRRK